MQQETGKAKGAIRSRLTYANVVATLALVMATSGATAFAASQLGKNSVGSRQLKAKSVTTGKLAPNAINSSKVANHSLTGADINLSALGTVPSATTAASAGNSNTLAGHAAGCPSATILIRGTCFDLTSNPVAPNLEAAAEACARKGGYLPTPMQLYSTKGILNLGDGIGPSQHQFTDDLYSKVGEGKYSTILLDGAGPPEEHEASQPSAYFCAYQLLR